MAEPVTFLSANNSSRRAGHGASLFTPGAQFLLWAARTWIRRVMLGTPALPALRQRFLRAGAQGALPYFDGFMHFLVLRQVLPPDFDWRYGSELTEMEVEFLEGLSRLAEGRPEALVIFVRRRVACAAARVAARHLAVELVDEMALADMPLALPNERFQEEERWLVACVSELRSESNVSCLPSILRNTANDGGEQR